MCRSHGSLSHSNGWLQILHDLSFGKPIDEMLWKSFKSQEART